LKAKVLSGTSVRFLEFLQAKSSEFLGERPVSLPRRTSLANPLLKARAAMETQSKLKVRVQQASESSCGVNVSRLLTQ